MSRHAPFLKRLQLAVLDHLGATRKAWSAGDLAAEIGEYSTSVYTSLTSLHRLGLVEVADGRPKRWGVTVDGYAAFEEIRCA